MDSHIACNPYTTRLNVIGSFLRFIKWHVPGFAFARQIYTEVYSLLLFRQRVVHNLPSFIAMGGVGCILKTSFRKLSPGHSPELKTRTTRPGASVSSGTPSQPGLVRNGSYLSRSQLYLPLWPAAIGQMVPSFFLRAQSHMPQKNGWTTAGPPPDWQNCWWTL